MLQKQFDLHKTKKIEALESGRAMLQTHLLQNQKIELARNSKRCYYGERLFLWFEGISDENNEIIDKVSERILKID